MQESGPSAGNGISLAGPQTGCAIFLVGPSTKGLLELRRTEPQDKSISVSLTPPASGRHHRSTPESQLLQVQFMLSLMEKSQRTWDSKRLLLGFGKICGKIDSKIAWNKTKNNCDPKGDAWSGWCLTWTLRFSNSGHWKVWFWFECDSVLLPYKQQSCPFHWHIHSHL